MKIPLWRRIALRLTRWIWLPILRRVEVRYFRGDTDTGAHPHALFVWSVLRDELELPKLELPIFCKGCRVYHLTARPCTPQINN